MNKNTIKLILTVFLLAVALTGCSAQFEQMLGDVAPAEVEVTAETGPEPNPDLSPEEVVKIQVTALQNNDEEDTGIKTTFKFASLQNRQITGPLARFRELVREKAYRPLLNHKLAEYDPIEIDGDTATQRVTITAKNGQATVYMFTLSKQKNPSCEGCWMTDSVIMIPTRSQDLKGI